MSPQRFLASSPRIISRGTVCVTFCITLLFTPCWVFAVEGTRPIKPMTMNDVIKLLEADIGEAVILKQLKATSTHLVPTVDALLQLKAAGASDHFLEAILGSGLGSEVGANPRQPPTDIRQPEAPPKAVSPAGPAQRDQAPRSYRLYTTVNEQGEPIVHMTNLDRNGRRIGGEVLHSTSRNVIEPRWDPGAVGSYDTQSQKRHDESDHNTAQDPPPVVVNIYPPASSEPDPSPGEQPYYPASSQSAYPQANLGIYPGFYPGELNFSPRIQRYGSRYGYYASPYLVGAYGGYRHTLSPPGSYSHFVTHHRPAGAHHFSRYYVGGYGDYRRHGIYGGQRVHSGHGSQRSHTRGAAGRNRALFTHR